MKETAIIYCRKSTDREDRQQNSLRFQKGVCFKNLKNNELKLYNNWVDKWYIEESFSAKIEWKRPWFLRMLKEIKTWNIDYIIVDEPKRLSRNTLDSARFIDLLENNLIKWLITTWRTYYWDNTSDMFLLELDLWLANKDRGTDIRKKMMTALHRWQLLSQVIFWYRNVWPKGKKDIQVIEEESKIVLKAFIMRSQNKTLKEIADFINEKNGTKWNSERVSKMLVNTKYYWLQKFWWEEALLNSPWYKPIISKELFEKVNWITRVKEYKKWNNWTRYFQGILFDTQLNKLYPTQTKWNIYYHQWAKTNYNINISQKKLFEEFEKYIGNYNFLKPFIALSKSTLKDYYKDKVNQRKSELTKITKELNQVNERLNSLLDKLLDNIIDKKTYDFKKEELENNKLELEEKYKALKQDNSNIINIIENLCKLVENLSESYKTWNEQEKWKIIRALQCKLILNNKKQLTIQDSKLFEMIKSLNFHKWYSHGELNSSQSLEKALS